MTEYTLVGYSLDIERKQEGDSQLVHKLMGNLEAVCDKHDGLPFKEGLAEIGHVGNPSFENHFKTEETQEYARNRSRYLVGAVWVENSVDLFNGRIGADIRYESGQDVDSLLKDFDELFQEGEKHETKIRVPEDCGSKI